MESEWEKRMKEVLERCRRGNIYQCPKCTKTFSSGQALGGHHTGHVRREQKQLIVRGESSVSRLMNGSVPFYYSLSSIMKRPHVSCLDDSINQKRPCAHNRSLVINEMHQEAENISSVTSKMHVLFGDRHVSVEVGVPAADDKIKGKSVVDVDKDCNGHQEVKKNGSTDDDDDGEDGNPMNLDLSLHL